MKSKTQKSNSGVAQSFFAYCEACGWRGAHWTHASAKRDAENELKWHKEHCPALDPKCENNTLETKKLSLNWCNLCGTEHTSVRASDRCKERYEQNKRNSQLGVKS